MRYFLIPLILILAGCSHQSTADNNQAFLEPAKTEQLTASSPQPARRGLNYDLQMLHAHCMGEAYGLKTKDITFIPKCERDKALAIYREYHPEYIDIVQYRLDEEIVLFGELQKHKITQSQFQAKLSALGAKEHDMIDRRANMMEQRIDRDYGDLAVSSPIIINQPPVSTPTPNPPTHIHCDTQTDAAGNSSTNCY